MFSKVLLALSILTAPAAFAATEVTCVSDKNAHAYYGDQGQWIIHFDTQVDEEEIIHVSMENKSHRILGFRNSEAAADPKFKAKNPKYSDYSRYNFADAWCGYSLLLPKGLSQIEDRFTGQVYSACEAGDGGTFKIYCYKN